ATPLDLPEIIPGMSKAKALLLDDRGVTTISGINFKNTFLKEIAIIEMVAAVKALVSPVLLFHGREDRVVDFRNHEIFVDNISSACRSVIINDGDHNLTRDI